MKVHIFDVEHGGCAAIVSPSGKLLMIDCDNNDTTGWRPSKWVAANGLSVANLTITNFDEDHVGDLPALRPYIESFTVNWNVPTVWVRAMKAAEGIGPGVHETLDMMDDKVGGAYPIDWGEGFALRRFYHDLHAFQDENSLSVVTFVRYGGVQIVFPGDLTKAAWHTFMRDPDFMLNLHSTRILVASHHGREDGYCPEIFRDWTPDVVIVSDKRIMHESQIVDYGRHSRGIKWNGTDVRRCLTTRYDGDLTITPTLGGGFWITASR